MRRLGGRPGEARSTVKVVVVVLAGSVTDWPLVMLLPFRETTAFCNVPKSSLTSLLFGALVLFAVTVAVRTPPLTEVVTVTLGRGPQVTALTVIVTVAVFETRPSGSVTR